MSEGTGLRLAEGRAGVELLRTSAIWGWAAQLGRGRGSHGRPLGSRLHGLRLRLRLRLQLAHGRTAGRPRHALGRVLQRSELLLLLLLRRRRLALGRRALGRLLVRRGQARLGRQALGRAGRQGAGAGPERERGGARGQ